MDIFPYEIHQTLFVGPNSVIVEGVSDLLFIQVVSGVLRRAGRQGLDERWTVTPVGGSAKVPTFVSLLGSQKNLKVATLIDFQKRDLPMIENLFKRTSPSRTTVDAPLAGRSCGFAGDAEQDLAAGDGAGHPTPRGGSMTLAISWLHDGGETVGAWLHEAGDWQWWRCFGGAKRIKPPGPDYLRVPEWIAPS